MLKLSLKNAYTYKRRNSEMNSASYIAGTTVDHSSHLLQNILYALTVLDKGKKSCIFTMKTY